MIGIDSIHGGSILKHGLMWTFAAMA